MSEYDIIPGRIMYALNAWADKAQFPGDFLRCVLENDLMGAMGRADPECRRVLPAITTYVFNKMPGDCHGSAERMRAYAEKMHHREGRAGVHARWEKVQP